MPTDKTRGMHLLIEFAIKQVADPDGSVVFDVLCGSTEPDTIFEVYAHPCNPANFPAIENVKYHQSFEFSSSYHYHWMNAKFNSQTFYTMLVIQKNSGKITGYSDLCTFYMAKDNTGIYGNQYKYLPNWPDPTGWIVINRAGYNDPLDPGKDGKFVDYANSNSKTGAIAWYALLPGGERSVTPVEAPEPLKGPNGNSFDPLAPEYLVYRNKQDTGRNINKFFMVDDNVTNANASDRDKWSSFMERGNGGIIRTTPDISKLFPNSGKANQKVEKDEQLEKIPVVELFDDDGEKVVFQLLDTIEYEGEQYSIITPYYETAEEYNLEEPAPVFVMKEVADEHGDESALETIEDEDLLKEIYTLFKDKHTEFEFRG